MAAGSGSSGGLGPAHAAPHGAGDDVPRGDPGVADRRREAVAETLLECPQQGLTDDVEVLESHAVAHVAGPQPDEERADDVEVREPVDGGLHRRHRLLRLRADVVVEQCPGARREREDPLVEQQPGRVGDRQQRDGTRIGRARSGCR